MNEKINEIYNSVIVKIKKEILDSIHPVGSYYWSQKEKDPSGIFGGKWESIKGRFLFASDEKHSVDSSGGNEFHTLNIEEIPTHSVVQIGGKDEEKKIYENEGIFYKTKEIGGGKPHNNMPPFICAFCWRRIE